jgi:broad specificity phosphatase PhoE
MVVAVTHVSVIRAAIVCALQAEPRSFWHIGIAPPSPVRLSGHDGHWTLAWMTSGKTGVSGED